MMGDRLIVAVEGADVLVYIHYAPDDLLAKLEKFNADFDQRRGFDDPSYKVARLVHMLIASDNPDDTTGYGAYSNSILTAAGGADYTLRYNKPVQINFQEESN